MNMAPKNNFLKNYGSILLLILGIFIGSLVGLFAVDLIDYLKPVGDIFLNLLFTVVIPLIFFAIASAVANIEEGRRLGKILSLMALVFLGTVVFAAIIMIFAVWLIPLQEGLAVMGINELSIKGDEEDWAQNIVQFVTVNEFNQILSRQHMVAFIIFSFIIGMAALRSGDKGLIFRQFLNAGNEVMKVALMMIMRLAPIVLGAYLAYQVWTVG